MTFGGQGSSVSEVKRTRSSKIELCLTWTRVKCFHKTQWTRRAFSGEPRVMGHHPVTSVALNSERMTMSAAAAAATAATCERHGDNVGSVVVVLLRGFLFCSNARQLGFHILEQMFTVMSKNSIAESDFRCNSDVVTGGVPCPWPEWTSPKHLTFNRTHNKTTLTRSPV